MKKKIQYTKTMSSTSKTNTEDIVRSPKRNANKICFPIVNEQWKRTSGFRVPFSTRNFCIACFSANIFFSFCRILVYFRLYNQYCALQSQKCNKRQKKKRSFCSLSLWIHHIEEKSGALIPSALRGPQLNERALRRQPKLLITHRHSIPRLFNSPGC